MPVAAVFAARCWPELWAACTEDVLRAKDLSFVTLQRKQLPDKLSDELAFVAGAIEEGSRVEFKPIEGAVEVGKGLLRAMAFLWVL